MQEDLGLKPNQRADLIQSIDILINCAANIDIEEKLDVAVKCNVQGPLYLLKLA